jgi:hypothetical protein
VAATHHLTGEFVVRNDPGDLDETQRTALLEAIQAAIASFGGAGDTRTTAYITWYDTQEE